MSLHKAFIATLALATGLIAVSSANAGLPETREDGVTVIHLDQHGGHFSAKETLASLKAGKYEFVISNKTDKLVGFQIQNFKTQETVDMFPLEVGETKSSIVTVTTDGVRFRCPINPTPWYDLDNVKTR